MHLADVTLADRHDPYTGETQALVHPSDVFLVPREAIHRFRQDDIKPTLGRIRDQFRKRQPNTARG